MSWFFSGPELGDAKLEANRRSRRRAKRKAGGYPASPDSDSIFEDLAFLKRRAAADGFFGDHLEVEDLRQQVDALLHARERAYKIDADAHERKASFRVQIAADWTPIVLKTLAALTVVATVVVGLTTMSGSQYIELVHWVLRPPVPYAGGVVALAAASAVGLKRRRDVEMGSEAGRRTRGSPDPAPSKQLK